MREPREEGRERPGSDLDDKVAFLRRPDSYPGTTDAVDAIETHMSWVFLTNDRAYKLKKPVRHEHLDFSTLDAREHDCREEVRLNRRLAPEVYLGVERLSRHGDGQLALGGDGTVVDWLVVMRRLPARRMLDTLIARDAVDPALLNAVGRLMGEFYAGLPAEPVTADAYVDRFRDDIQRNRDELGHRHSRLDVAGVGTLCDQQLAWLERHAGALGARAANGRIVEAHGDLRPEHVCLTDPPVVIDCLEFSRALRLLDPADELAYLALECERLGAPAAGGTVLQTGLGYSGDRPGEALIHFYQSFRACVRAKLAVWHYTRDHSEDLGKWTERARHYLRLADRYIRAAD